MADHVIFAQDVRASYSGAAVLRGASVSLNSREIVGLIGPNGAGKTTLLRCMAGLMEAEAKSLRVLGRDVRAETPLGLRMAGLGYVPQERNVFPNLTVRENLETAFHVAGRGPGVELADRVGFVERLFPRLAERRNQQAGLMSGGEQRMVAVAMGLILKPRVLLLDEPTTGLAPLVVHQLMDTIRRLRDTEGISILLVEQNIASMLRIVDRLYVIKEGATHEFEGNPQDVGQRNIWEYL